MTPFTCIYSSECVEPAKQLVNTFLNMFAFEQQLSFDDLFWYGVFCKPETYANYGHWDEINAETDGYMDAITSPCASESERLDLVETLIDRIIKGETDKPEWMVQIEATEVCGEYEMAPSTFLYLIPKKAEYKELADSLINFLYSPNLMITMLKD